VHNPEEDEHDSDYTLPLEGASRRLAVVVAALALSAMPARPANAADPVAAAPAPATSSNDWPAFHGGGPLRGEATGEALGAPPMNVRWTYYTDEKEPAAIEGGAAIVGQTVYVGDTKGTLHAVDPRDGQA
jgi:outer membrane protein assembly factor BamB